MTLSHLTKTTRKTSASIKPAPSDLNSPEELQAARNALIQEFKWLEEVVTQRVKEYLEDKVPDTIPEPPPLDPQSPYAALIEQLSLSKEDRLVLTLAIAPNLRPEVLNDLLCDANRRYIPPFSALGGYIDKVYLKFIPTVGTAVYLLAGSDKNKALSTILRLRSNDILEKNNLIHIAPSEVSINKEDYLNYTVGMSDQTVQYILSGKQPTPAYSADFPAKIISTTARWDDLILSEHVMRKINKIIAWQKHSAQLIDENEGKISPIFPILFYGPPGTGKTLTVKLLGKELGMQVVRIDLSAIVSKYVGETEKNLERIFEMAKGQNWILFFDEADAIFGRRTAVKDANDRYGNMEVSYLLQRIEEYTGMVILATNLKHNIDKALMRRFQLMIEFNRPNAEEQLQLWKALKPAKFKYASNINFDYFSQRMLTGSNIANILKMACLDCMSNNTDTITPEMLVVNASDELAKTGRTL